MAASSTSFRSGPDPRRHQLTPEERQRGGRNATSRKPFVKGHDPRRRRFSREECVMAGRKGFRTTMERGKATSRVREKIYSHYSKNKWGNGGKKAKKKTA